jgi:catechol 2,3-dioxygenase-like lactoylglutathione lyase family enzyme
MVKREEYRRILHLDMPCSISYYMKHMKIHRIDHVGVVVNDLSAAKAFFLDLGLEVQGETEVEGELLDQVTGLNDVKTAVVMLGTPDGQANIELIKFYTPSDEKDMQQPFANTLVPGDAGWLDCVRSLRPSMISC